MYFISPDTVHVLDINLIDFQYFPYKGTSVKLKYIWEVQF